jgi:hypothetical protein
MRYWQSASCRLSVRRLPAPHPITDVLFTWRPALRRTHGHTASVIRYLRSPPRHRRLTRPARRPAGSAPG